MWFGTGSYSEMAGEQIPKVTFFRFNWNLEVRGELLQMRERERQREGERKTTVRKWVKMLLEKVKERDTERERASTRRILTEEIGRESGRCCMSNRKRRREWVIEREEESERERVENMKYVASIRNGYLWSSILLIFYPRVRDRP